jgi:hypothetical protein
MMRGFTLEVNFSMQAMAALCKEAAKSDKTIDELVSEAVYCWFSPEEAEEAKP